MHDTSTFEGYDHPDLRRCLARGEKSGRGARENWEIESRKKTLHRVVRLENRGVTIKGRNVK